MCKFIYFQFYGAFYTKNLVLYHSVKQLLYHSVRSIKKSMELLFLTKMLKNLSLCANFGHNKFFTHSLWRWNHGFSDGNFLLVFHFLCLHTTNFWMQTTFVDSVGWRGGGGGGGFGGVGLLYCRQWVLC